MKIACVSDLHGHLPEVPECDLLLIGGDIGPGRRPRDEDDYRREAVWYDTTLREWLRIIDVPVVAVAGNHDFLFQDQPGMVPDLPWSYLQDSGCEYEGLRIWGSPWQPYFGGWSFNEDEFELHRIWQTIPEDTDVLLLHGPPLGYGDLSPYGHTHVGSPSLAERIREIQPHLVIYGHIHSGYGEYRLSDSILVNAALCDEQYRPVNPIRVIEIP